MSRETVRTARPPLIVTRVFRQGLRDADSSKETPNPTKAQIDRAWEVLELNYVKGWGKND